MQAANFGNLQDLPTSGRSIGRPSGASFSRAR
jgi:hypothetical protein